MAQHNDEHDTPRSPVINKTHHDMEGNFTSAKVDMMHRKICTFQVYTNLFAYDPAYLKDPAGLGLASCGLACQVQQTFHRLPIGRTRSTFDKALIVNTWTLRIPSKMHIERPRAAGVA